MGEQSSSNVLVSLKLTFLVIVDREILSVNYSEAAPYRTPHFCGTEAQFRCLVVLPSTERCASRRMFGRTLLSTFH
jgi:hypothetical protein